MRFRHFFLPFCIFSVGAGAQTSASLTAGEVIVTTPPANAPVVSEGQSSDKITYLDYKSVYEAASLEEEVKMAAERFKLSQDQQEMWTQAAEDRRKVEQQAKEKLSTATNSYEKDPIYRGLRTAQNDFYTTIVGYLTPVQKQYFETDRLILQEKQQRLAKLPPPPPPAPTVTAVPIDSVLTKEPQKEPAKAKAKKRKKEVGG
jgi:hypothetical protein